MGASRRKMGEKPQRAQSRQGTLPSPSKRVLRSQDGRRYGGIKGIPGVEMCREAWNTKSLSPEIELQL